MYEYFAELRRVVDGDTVDVTIDCGFNMHVKERVRLKGINTPECRTRDLEEKALGLDATAWMKEHLEGAIKGDDELTIRTIIKKTPSAKIIFHYETFNETGALLNTGEVILVFINKGTGKVCSAPAIVLNKFKESI